MKKSIKFLAMALCLALVISLCVAMFAANTKTSAYDYKEGEWVEEGTTFKFDGKDYTVQNDANLTGKYIDVNGTNYYLISNANDMLAVGLTSGEESFIITDDIDLGVWTMEISVFISVIEGCGNTVTFGEGSTYGLFNAVAGNINNLVLDGTINAETTLLGGLAKTFMNGKIDGIINNADITNTLAHVDGHEPKTGGIIGAADLSFGNFEIYNCVNNGDITGYTRVAGIIANLQTSPWNDTNASGVLNVNGCSNTGTLTSTDWGAAGICSIVEFYGSGEVNIVNCQNSGNIIGRFSSAGIVGTWISNGRMEACVNTGNITSRDEASAGIVGRVSCGENATVTVSNCANLGTVASETANVAGIIGLNRTSLLYVQQCFSVGTLTPGTIEGTPKSAFGVMDRESASTSALVERCFYMNAETGMDIETNERDV
ncbi:MAG: hypothetical protein IJV72_05750, partial [Clostridia bacterium]|nr:hypothetical protein [Clostridia bacterium]